MKKYFRDFIRLIFIFLKYPLHGALIISFLITAISPPINVLASSTKKSDEKSDSNSLSIQTVRTLMNSPELYIGLESLPEVNLHKESCSNDSCSTWVFGNTIGTTLDSAVGIIFKAEVEGEIGKRMNCDHAGCNDSISMFADTSDNFTSYPNNSTYCVANYGFGLDKYATCNQMAPSAIPLLLGVNGFPSDPNTDLAGGFAVGWHKSVDATLRIYDIHFIYYGVPPIGALTRSLLSNNKPKNGSGDPRECAVNACTNAVAAAGDPIDTRTGNFDFSLVDLSLQTIAGPLSFQRSYASLATDTNIYPTDLGPGWTHNQDIRLIFEANTIYFKAHTLNQYHFTDNGNQTYTPYAGVLASLTYDAGNNTYTIKASDQATYTFNSSGRLLNWRNEPGYGFDYTYNNNQLYRVTEPVSGRYLQFNYQNSHLVSVNDHTARQVSYGYESNNDLTAYTDARGKTWTYEYDGTSHRLASVVEPSTFASEILRIVYDAQGRATEQFDGANQRIVKITFNTDGTSNIEDALGREATHSYDQRNTNTRRTDTSGYTIQNAYDANFRPAQVQDQDNRTLQYTWNVNGANLTHIKDAANHEIFLQYDSGNHLTQIKDPLYNPAVPNNHVINYAYTGSLLTGTTRQTVEWGPISTSYTYTTTADAPQPVGLLKTITDALGHITHLTYDTAGQLIMIRDAESHTTQFAYDNLGQVTDVTNPLGRVTHTQYDVAGNITKVIQNYDTTKARNEQNLYNLTTEFFYDDQERLYQTLDTLGATTTYIYDAAGRVYQVTNANGKTSTSVYNAAGQLTSVTDPLGHSTGYEYDAAGRLWKIKDALDRVILTYAYNSDSTLLTETYPTPNGDYIITYESYDALKRPIRVSDNAGHVSEVTYDAYGNPLTHIDALGCVTKYEYNDLGLLSVVVQNYKANPGSGDDPNATNTRTEYTYDKVGSLKKIKDANGHETIFDYDVLNRLWRITDPIGHVTEFGYDALGNRTSLKDANNQTTLFNYDLASRLDIIDYPSGMADVDFGYDALGRLTGMDDSLGHTTWSYDNLSRVTSITSPFNKTVGYGYDDDGKRNSITYPAPVNKTISYQYNTLDQLTGVLDGPTSLASYTYDITGRLNGVSLANGVTASMGYDLAGQITNLAYTKDANQLAQYTYQYDQVGNREQVQETVYYPHFVFLPAIHNVGGAEQMQSLAAGSENGEMDVATEAMVGGYPAPGEETHLESSVEGMEPQDSESSYPAPQEPGSSETSFFQKIWSFMAWLFVDRVPTVSAHSDLQSGYPAPNTLPPVSSSNTPQTIQYEYDALNRLIGADYTTGQDYVFTYDKVGNRMSQTVGSTTTAYQYDAADRLTNVEGMTFTWDNNGNLLNDGVNTYSYDFANRLTAVSGQGSSFSFGYDGLGNRYQQTANGQATTYTLDLAGDLSQVLNDGEFSYYYGLGRISQQKNGVSEYFLTDALGSGRQIANASGFVTYGQVFDPFGNLMAASGISSSNFGYAGEWTDASGLQYLRARYYSPEQGRFISEDPYPGTLTQPASMTPYTYALNNPVLYSDPSGEFVPILAIAGLGFAAGAIINTYQQTNGFTSFCDFDIVEALAWGVGGAAAATSITIMSVSLVGGAGMGLQGLALLFYGSNIPIAVAASTGIWAGGSTAIGFSALATTWLFSNQLSSPLFSNPVGLANTRANTLQQALPQGTQGRVTMAAGVVENTSGTRQVLIGTSEPNGYIRPSVRPLIGPNEVVVTGIGHAEENIVNWATSNNQRVIAVGAGRPICAACARIIENAGAFLASPFKR